jgi:lipopolysaccharide heptosyltransferase II
MKILVVGPSWIGDTVLAQPLFCLLHAQHPDLKLDVIAPAWTLPVLRRMREVRRVDAHEFAHGEFKLSARYRLGRQLRNERYDQAIVLPNTFKSALPALFAGIAVRTGYRGETRWGVLNDVRHLDERGHPQIVQRYAALALRAGARLPAQLPQPHLRVQESARRSTLARLGLAEERTAIAFCPGAEYGPAKRWPAPYFAQLARKLAEQGVTVLLVGSTSDQAIGEQIETLAPGACINLCGKTTLDEAIDVLASARVVVTNDTGLMHIAAAVRTPLIAIYGSSTPVFTPPISDLATILKLDMPCSPCFERTCPLGHFDCMNQLKPERVLSAVRERLAGAIPMRSVTADQ